MCIALYTMLLLMYNMINFIYRFLPANEHMSNRGRHGQNAILVLYLPEHFEELLHFQPGDRVYFMVGKTGTYAQYTLVSEDNVYPLHEKLSFKEGAILAVPYFTAHRALVKR